MKNSYTENMADMMSYCERKEVKNILEAWETNGLPQNFSDDNVRFGFNRNSGYVFLVNDDYQTAMINSDTGNLEIFHSTPYEGIEGFLSDILKEHAPDDLHHEDVEYIRQQAKNEDVELPENWKE